jgi:hypothetical protein
LTFAQKYDIILKKPFFKIASTFKVNLSISAQNDKIFASLILIKLQPTRDQQEKKKKGLADF